MAKNKNYISGRKKEYKTKKILENKGYLTFRTAGSHSPFDIIAINNKKIKLIQIKSVKNKSSKTNIIKRYKKEIEMIKEIQKKISKKVEIELWVWFFHETKPKRILFKKNKIIEIINNI